LEGGHNEHVLQQTTPRL